jgi:hypothetical protein
MKVGDKVGVKPWMGELNELYYAKMYSDKYYTYIQKSSTGNIEVKCDNGFTWYFPEEAVYLVDEQKSDLQIIKDAFLGKAVFQGYHTSTIADDKFFTLTEGSLIESEDKTMYYHEDIDYTGMLMYEGKLVAITVEDYVRQKYQSGSVVKCLVTGIKVCITGGYEISFDEDKQTIDITRRSFGDGITVFRRGIWAEKGGETNSKPTEFAESLAKAVQFPMTVEQAYDAGYVKAAPNEDPCVIKTKKSKGLDINIKSSKFVIPKIK